MRRITCQECGRAYDYDQDDFCPKCGGYNAPAGTGATALEAQLLTRFDENRARRAPGSMPEPPRGSAASHDPFAPRSQNAPPRLAPHLCTTPDETPIPRPRRTLLLLLIALLVAVTIAIAALPSLLYSPPGGAQGEYAVGETFRLGKLSVAVDGCNWFELPEDSRLARPGFDILAVDLYAEGGDSYDSTDPVGCATLLLDTGDSLSPETDVLLKKRLEVLGLYPIAINDALWQDPLLGQLIFYVPDGVESATLTLGELRPGKNGDIVATRTVPITLPPR